MSGQFFFFAPLKSISTSLISADHVSANTTLDNWLMGAMPTIRISISVLSSSNMIIRKSNFKVNYSVSTSTINALGTEGTMVVDNCTFDSNLSDRDKTMSLAFADANITD